MAALTMRAPEGKRDCHLHLADTAPLSLGDTVRRSRFSSAISSSSQRRPRAIDATKVARFSERIGRGVLRRHSATTRHDFVQLPA